MTDLKPKFSPSIFNKVRLFIICIHNFRILQGTIIFYSLLTSKEDTRDKTNQINPFIYMMQ
jgi:hypothetical protein